MRSLAFTSVLLLLVACGTLVSTKRPANQCRGGCPYNYDPVCGTDGKTYPNDCALGLEACKFPHLNLKVDYDGECR